MNNMSNQDFHSMRTTGAALAIAGLTLCLNIGCGNKTQPSSVEASVNPMGSPKAESKSGQSQRVEPEVQAEIGRMEAERRAKLLADAQSALEETRDAITALDKGDKHGALAALEQATGKLDLIVARDRSLALAPVAVSTTILDLYASVDTVKAAIKQAREDLSNNQVQDARTLLQGLASQVDIQVTNIPLATYPAAIKAVVPLIDAGQVDAATTALYTALNTLVIEDFIIALPGIRAQSMLREAESLAAKSNRTAEENNRLQGLIASAQNEIQLAEALGYGTKDNYKPLYQQISEIRKQTEAGQSGKSVFEKLRDSLKRFKFLG
jgi:hypothetical protein